MRLIDPSEHADYLEALHGRGLSGRDFTLHETDTTDPKSDENIGQQGFVTITRRSTRVTKEYPLGDASDWLQHFKKDLEAGAFDQANNGSHAAGA
ncbi:transcriptional regulator [Burkholderia oklahomensis]|uniref:transcriptional regulator n=1 Tax=Burkholderia oklahomensis TaxID=342113 RepID=UPI00264F603E|nr:transcriptional regulator [Burkholderia oklahomensis]MDN7675394.1 transcriptional regulator [Burkholderia oklahomensis]